MTALPPYSLFEKTARTIARDGTELAYTVLGDGDATPLVFANGWSCSDSYWRWIVPPLVEAGHRCLVHDTRGHGESGLPREPGRGARALTVDDLSVTTLAADLLGLIEVAELGPSMLVGHSMGVQTIVEAARDHDGRVAGLVAVAGAYENPLLTFYGLPYALAHRAFPLVRHLARHAPELLVPLWAIIDDAPWAVPAARLVGAAGPKTTREGLAPYLRHLGAQRADVLFALVGAMRDHSAADVLPDLDVPLLVLAAARDTFTPPRCSKRMHELAPESEIVWFDDGHHTLPIEEPERIADLIGEFALRHAPVRV